MGFTTAAGAGLLQYLTGVFQRSQLGRRTPASRPANKAYEAFDKAYEKRVNDIGQGRRPMQVELVENAPSDDFNIYNPLATNDKFAGNAVNTRTNNPVIDINPNVDEVYLAHELGHVASKHTDIGSLIRNLRDNPKLSNALGGALFTLPGVAAALESGDDDMDTSIALAAAAGLPTLIDEGLATKNGLAIMNMAGRRASLGQRGKLAGSFLSYLTPALVAGTAGNVVGNIVDSDPSGL